MYEIREMPMTIECAFIRYIAVKQCFDSFHFGMHDLGIA